MAAAQPSGNDLSEDVQEKIRLFWDQERTITDLESRLEKLRSDHAQLKAELQPYHNELSFKLDIHRRDVSPNPVLIHRCPEEVLYRIFEFYLVPAHNCIRTLLLVCKYWHRLTMDSPLLWARIQSPAILDDYESHSRFDSVVAPYVYACLERSRGLPLDILLNLRCLPSREEYLHSRIRASLEGVIDDESFATIQMWVRGQTWSIASWRYDYQFINLIVANIKRWRHLSLVLPSHDFDAEGTLLRHLSLQDTRLASFDLGRVTVMERDSNSHYCYRLPNISELKGINASQMFISCFNGSPRLLKDLTISPPSLLHLQDLSACISIRKLFISMDCFDLDNPTAAFTLSLPRLNDLTLVGYLNPLTSIIFDTPTLDRLEIRNEGPPDSRRRTGSPRRIIRRGSLRRIMPTFGLPKITSRWVVWKLEAWNTIEFLNGIQHVLSLSTETELVTVTAPAGSGTVEAILHLDGSDLPMKVKHITGNSGMGHEEACRAVKWFERWAGKNSCSFKDDSIA